jgi:hypothetical protein
MNASAPPGTLAMGDLVPVLFKAWRRGGAWDEARSEPEVLRLPPDARDSSPIGVVREIVLEALLDLGEGWVPWSALSGYLRSDHRMAGISRLLRRWVERVGAESVEPIDLARRIVQESLPALGMIDLGEEDAYADSAADDEPQDPDASGPGPAPDARSTLTLRLTARGRALLQDRPLSTDATRSKFLDTHVLRVGPSARVCAILAVAPFVEVARAQETVDLVVAPQTLARALSAGFDAEALKQRIEALAPLPESLSRTLAQASVVVGRGTFTPGGGFLWVEDANVRELLRTRRATAEMFVDPSPPAGLIVAAGIDLERLTRRCRAVGVEIMADGEVVRVRTMPPPAVKQTPARGTGNK